MKLLLSILLISILSGAALAQTTVNGTVTEALSGKSIAGVNVMVKDLSGKLIGFSQSDETGKFSLEVNLPSDSIMLTATMLGYKPYAQKVKFSSEPVSILMEDGALQLQEVVVKSNRMRENGDTITYNVAGFAQKQDKTIGDVLKRMPGIDVSNSGKIQYQGTDINKFYIEGNDLLGGKYGIATNGISHQDIGAVEVMENHQPMQVLRGLSFSDQAAINLKMKNRAKATFLIHGTAGGGWSQQPRGMLWNGDIFTMMVTGKYQMITTLKTNNIGLNLANQLTDFTSDKSDETISGYISLSSPSTPNMERKRSYFNRSWMVSSSHLLKTAKGGEFKAQVDYSNDRVTAQGNSSTTYFLESGDKVIVEDKNSLGHRNAVDGKFSFELNEKTYFLNNTLTANFSWNDLTLNTSGTLPNSQAARMPEYSVSNLLKIIKRFRNNRLVTFTSRNEWNSLPEHLTVSHDGISYGERIRQHAFYTDERASLGFVLKRLVLSLEGGIAGYFRNLDTGLWGIEADGIMSSEALTTDYLRVFASPKLDWSHGKIELTMKVPVNLYSYFFSGAMQNRTEFFVSPSLSVRWRITPRMTLSLRGSARRSPASLHNIHDSSILTDYRSFSAGVDDYYTASGQSVSVSYSLRNTQTGIFIIAMGGLGWNKSKFGTVQEISGDYIFHSYRSKPSESRTASAMLNVTKSLDFMRGAVGMRGNYARNENSLLSQGVNTRYQNDSFSLSPFMNGNISSYFNWNLGFTWDRSLLSISDMSTRHTDNYIYKGSLTLTPCDLVTWTVGGEIYRNQIEEGRHKNMTMLDTKLSFNITKRLEISASVTNLLNRKTYSYTTYSTVSQLERSSLLRGREFMLSIYLKK